MEKQPPVVIEFVSGSRIHQADTITANTLILLSSGQEIPIPSDQIVLGEDHHGAARVGLGGMSFEGVENDHLIFWRVCDLLPEEALPPSREIKVALHRDHVSSVSVQGTRVWPKKLPKKQAKTRASRPQAC